jgi:hypothetical protein
MGTVGVMLLGVDDRDMFMRFRGGGVGHKAYAPKYVACWMIAANLTSAVSKRKEGSQSRSELEATEEDEDMIDEVEDNEEDKDGDTEDEGKDENKNEEYGDEDEDDLEGGEEGDEEVPAATPFEAYVDDEVADLRWITHMAALALIRSSMRTMKMRKSRTTRMPLARKMRRM